MKLWKAVTGQTEGAIYLKAGLLVVFLFFGVPALIAFAVVYLVMH